MNRYWKALIAFIAGLLVLLVVAIFLPKEKVLEVAAVQTIVTTLAVIAAPRNSNT